jgi:hypothetical protein
MTIERDPQLQFHEQGTLKAVTRWVSTHAEGIPEWLKNTRRAYQTDRFDVPEDQRVAALLLKDGGPDGPAQIGLLDVGGISAEDLERWSVWQDPRASSAGRDDVDEEQTQGNGGKAYMYAMFTGPARIIGIRGGIRSSKGFEGPPDSVERGRPGWMPNRAEGENAPSGPWEIELNQALRPYGTSFSRLPAPLRNALRQREAFTLVEGVEPTRIFQGKIDAAALVRDVARNEQSTLALEQLRVYAIHNGEVLFDGEAINLEEIPPYEGFETPRIIPIPEILPDEGGHTVSTTLDGNRPQGRVILRTSSDNMEKAWKRLRPRWRVTYRTQHQMIGSKQISELVPSAPGSQFIYVTVELSALEPDYVQHGRERPNDGPLIEAVDAFVADCIRELAREINERRRHEFDSQELDEIARENRMLDKWKDRFLPENMRSDGVEEGDRGRGRPRESGGRGERGLEPHIIEVTEPETAYTIGKDVSVNLAQILRPVVRDEFGRPVSGVALKYRCDDPDVLNIDEDEGTAVGRAKGECLVWVQIDPIGLVSTMVMFRIWVVDHVLLSPRQIELPVGKRRKIVAEVTNDDGHRSTEVLLNWRHSADDQLMIRIRPTGVVAANRIGMTEVIAGAGDPDRGGVWSRIPACVTIIEATEPEGPGEGRPQLRVTGRDRDPETGEIREGDPEEPALWQLASDVRHNVWWINLEAPPARFAMSKRATEPHLWRMLHAIKLTEMIQQVYMASEYIERGEQERPEPWAVHKGALERAEVQVAPEMWERLSDYIATGEEL